MPENNIESNSNSVTMIIRRNIHSGKEAEYLEWVNGVSTAAGKFQGFHSAKDFVSGGSSGEHTLVFSFSNQENLDNWLNSKEQKKWVGIVEQISDSPKVEKLSGLEFLFNYDFKPGSKPPAKYKMVLLTSLAIYLWQQIIMIPLLVPIFISIPGFISSLILTLLTVTVLTYILMPNLIKLFKSLLS